MSSSINSFINKSEANELKEIIFKRVRERSTLDNENVQSEIMDLARDAFVSNNNPFSQIIEQSAQKTLRPELELTNTTEEKINRVDNTNQPQRELNARALEQERTVSSEASAKVIQNNMMEARKSLSNNKGVLKALNFINSQAAISLMRTKADKFEVIV